MRVAVRLASATVALLSAASAGAQIEWSPVTGEFTARYMGYEDDSPREDRNHFGEGELRLHLGARLTPKLQLVAVPLVQYDTADKTSDELRFLEDDVQRPRGTFEELHVTYYGKTFELTVGKQLFSWGVSQGLKPTDNLNPADFLDVPTLHKIGVPAISFLRYGKIDVQLVLEPWFVPNRLPQPNNRWTILPEDALRQIEEVAGFEPPFLITRELPQQSLNNAQGGIRLRSSSLVTGWDLELSAFHGHDPFGLFEGRLQITPLAILVDAIYPEYTEVGGGFSTAIGRSTVHGEITYHRTSHEIDDDYFQYVGGFDYVIDSGIGRLDRIQFGLEYMGESIDNAHTRPPATFPTGFDRALPNSMVTGVEFVLSEETQVRMGGGLNFNDDDFTVRAQLSHELVEGLKIDVGVDVFSGPEGSFYGTWEENDRLFLFTTYVF